MAKAKKSEEKKTNTEQVEARPVGQGKDPLAEGNTLVNPTNSEAETHYEVKQTSAEATKIDGQDANERAEEHNAESADAPAETDPSQDEAAEGRTEESANQ